MNREWTKISDLLFFQEGPGVRNTQYAMEGVKLLNVANLVDGKVDLSTSERYISTEEAFGKYKHFLCDEGDFIVASSGIKVEYIDKKMGFVDKSMLPLCMNTSTIRFKVLNPKQLRIRYFMYYLKSQHFKCQLTRLITGSAQLNYGPSHLKQMIMPLISIDRQEEIVDKLDRLQSIIDLRKREIEKFNQLIKARFVELFGDINTNDKGWDSQSLGELCTIVRGGSPRPIENYLGGDVPWIKIGDATKGDNVYLHATKEHIIQDGVKKSRMVKSGSLIFANCGVSLGFARIITFDGCIHDGWLAMEAIDERLDKVFLLQALNQMTEHFRRIAPAGTQPNLNTAIMKDYKQIIPPLKLQREFLSFMEQVDKSKVAVQAALDEAQTLFDSLMQQYFG